MSSHTITATNGAGETSPLAVAGYAADRESRTIIHDLLDGTIGVSYVPPRPRSGTLVTVYEDRAQAWAAYHLYANSATFDYVPDDVPELGMTFTLDGRLNIEQDDDAPDVWYVNVDYQEVPA